MWTFTRPKIFCLEGCLREVKTLLQSRNSLDMLILALNRPQLSNETFLKDIFTPTINLSHNLYCLCPSEDLLLVISPDDFAVPTYTSYIITNMFRQIHFSGARKRYKQPGKSEQADQEVYKNT